MKYSYVPPVQVSRRNLNEVNLELDDYQDRTEFLPDNMTPNDWNRYIEKSVYLAMLQYGGDWDAEFSWRKT